MVASLRRRATAGCVAFFAALLSAAAPPARADTVTIPSSRDTTLYSENGALSNGAGDHFFAGRTKDGYLRRALVWFDVASSIPAGSTITGATVTLHLSRTRTGSLAVALHRVTAAWGEGTSHAAGEEGAGAPAAAGDATWTKRSYPSTSWSAAGGDYAAAASATASIGGTVGAYGWTGAALAADVRGWLDGAPNHGWILIAGATGPRETKRFDTHENPTVSARPALTVTFTPPATPTGACCGTDGSCTVVLDPGTACSGAYRGAGSSCTPDPCPAPTGACCLPVAAATCTSASEAECVSLGGTFRGAATSCALAACPVVLAPFVDPLPRPKVALPVTGTAGGAAAYVLSIIERTQKLHRDLPPTRVWGFDDGTGGTYPGPTIEARRDAAVEVTWRNDLRDPGGALRTAHLLPVDTCLEGAVDASPRTVIHLHGGHVDASSDGYPEATLLPGQEDVYAYPNWQQAATLWYHDHAMGITRLNVYLGLAGFYLVRDDVEDALGLPSGEYEIPLAIQDRTFRPDGSLEYPAAWHEHFFGETVLVNGVAWPYLDVHRGKYRLRLLNGSGSRSYRLRLSTGAALAVIGTDAGLLPAPVPVTSLLLTPGERADVVVDFEPYAGAEVLLLNDAPAPFPGPEGAGVVPQVMKFVVGSARGHTAPLPAALRTLAPLDPEGAAVTRDLVLEKSSGDTCTGTVWRIDGRGWSDVTERPALGTTEVWRFVNLSGTVHPMHMHLVAFQVLDRQPITVSGGVWAASGPAVPPAPVEAGWKDTVAVNPLEAVRVIARFEDFVGAFPYHCHILEHEDHAMMRQLETTTVCGDGARGLPLEACDDGNTVAGDGCSPACTSETCGDGVVQAAVEECDDGNGSSSDGCLPSCVAARCGDGFVRAGVEECDDRNTVAGDGCSPTCSVEHARLEAAEATGCGCGASGGLDVVALGLALAVLLRRRPGIPTSP